MFDIVSLNICFFLLKSLSLSKTANEPLYVVKKEEVDKDKVWIGSINHRVVLRNEFTEQIITTIIHRKYQVVQQIKRCIDAVHGWF